MSRITDPVMIQNYRVKVYNLLKTLGQKHWAARALKAPDVMHLNVLAGIAYRKMIEGKPEQSVRIRESFIQQGFDVKEALDGMHGRSIDQVRKDLDRDENLKKFREDSRTPTKKDGAKDESEPES